jgi:predicted MFS family arabinose efflux permease
VIGGALTGYLSWRWIFWLPAILSGVCLLLVVLLLPETARSIVGDGTGHVSGLRRTVLSYFRQLVSPSPHSHSVDPTADPIPARHGDQHARSLNPFHSLRLLWAKDTISITLVFGIFYMNLSALQASTSTLFAKVYRLDGIQLGLIYLPSGIGSCIGAYGAGKSHSQSPISQVR